jgi:hypothetical protein
MKDNKSMVFSKVLIIISFLAMIIANTLAVVLPLNGVTTGELSDLYKNLFVPAGITFSIWGVIYLLILGYVVYQLGIFQKEKSDAKVNMLKNVGLYFIISSLANASWIFAWHYKQVPLSLVLMIVILVCLIKIVSEISKVELSGLEKFFIKLPFSVYLGWITVATIANVTTLLVHIGWNGFGIPEQVWTIIVLIVGLIISLATMNKYNDIAYGLVIIWAYLGIVIKHTSIDGFAGQYSAIITTTSVCIAILIIFEVYLLIMRRKNSVK